VKFCKRLFFAFLHGLPFLKNYGENDLHNIYALKSEPLVWIYSDKHPLTSSILSFNDKHKRAVIGYNLLPKYWGKGYATEITRELVRYLFDVIKVERVEALVCDKNIPSKNVLKKSGFIQEGVLRNFALIHNTYVDVCYFGIVSKDYFNA
jgi:ribosomal-protein-alanine N-acetyltransferase